MITFKFVCPKFPNVNHSKTLHNGRFILTDSTRKFKEYIALAAKSQLKDFAEFAASLRAFDPTRHYISAEYMFYTPNMFTKEGKISQRKGDWDGNIKYVQDSCMAALGIDDSFILDATVKQYQSKSFDEVFVCIYRVCYLDSRFS